MAVDFVEDDHDPVANLAVPAQPWRRSGSGQQPAGRGLVAVFPASTWLAGMSLANKRLPSASWRRSARPPVNPPGWVRAAVMPPSWASRPSRSWILRDARRENLATPIVSTAMVGPLAPASDKIVGMRSGGEPLP